MPYVSFFSLESFVTMDRSCKVSGCLATIGNAVILQYNGVVESITVLLPLNPSTPKHWFLIWRGGGIQCFTWEKTKGFKPGTFSLQLTALSTWFQVTFNISQAPSKR